MFEKLSTNKSREQVFLNLTSQYGVQKYFFIRRFNEIYLCEIITKDHCIFKGRKTNKFYFLFGKIYFTHTSNKCYTTKSRLQKSLKFTKGYLKPTFTMQLHVH